MAEHNMPIGRLDTLPRKRLLSFATPLQEMANLSAAVGGPALYVKRDDLTGLAFGGNKVRQLEFYLGDAVERGADTILITGAVQSNFVRLAAAAARKCGMECHIQLEERVPKNDPLYKSSGNVLLDRILGATIHSYPHGEDEEGADARLHEIAADLEGQGRRPYIIPLAPGHAPLGALGYVDAARELLSQCEAAGLEFHEIVLASGSGHTHAGLLFGLRALGSDIPVTGICVRRPADRQMPRLASRCREIAELLDMDNVVSDQDVHVEDRHLAPGYGHMSETVRDALRLTAATEGLITDPVYTAKAMAGFLDRARALDGESRLLFVHTGGTPAVFAYEKELA
jgi:D-cysteine desulfhydrase family pyridoxal phosphate-dependent enzyme